MKKLLISLLVLSGIVGVMEARRKRAPQGIVEGEMDYHKKYGKKKGGWQMPWKKKPPVHSEPDILIDEGGMVIEEDVPMRATRS